MAFSLIPTLVFFRLFLTKDLYFHRVIKDILFSIKHILLSFTKLCENLKIGYICIWGLMASHSVG